MPMIKAECFVHRGNGVLPCVAFKTIYLYYESTHSPLNKPVDPFVGMWLSLRQLKQTYVIAELCPALPPCVSGVAEENEIEWRN